MIFLLFRVLSLLIFFLKNKHWKTDISAHLNHENGTKVVGTELDCSVIHHIRWGTCFPWLQRHGIPTFFPMGLVLWLPLANTSLSAFWWHFLHQGFHYSNQVLIQLKHVLGLLSIAQLLAFFKVGYLKGIGLLASLSELMSHATGIPGFKSHKLNFLCLLLIPAEE